MNQSYPDLIERLGEPQWWDECGVPRYAVFSPDLCNNIYAAEVALLKICCQACFREFLVALSWSRSDMVFGQPKCQLSIMARDKSIHYGDPPNVGCCAAGPTMNCEDLEVVEFWRRKHKEYVGTDNAVTDVEKFFQWTRIPELEIKLMDNPKLA